ncbi:MAG: hypothetical protein K9N01_09670 [Cephaloticoccus sp.]|nr:hypothetical protein [Cephaloticoccus sp.]
MNNDEAKFILRAYRPSGMDANDPMFTTALLQSRHDPLLGAWFSRAQTYDMVVAAKLREIVPPTDLRDRILAGGKDSRRRRVMPRRLVGWLALAASVAVVFALSEVWQGRRVEAAQTQFANFALNDFQHGRHHNAGGAVMDSVMGMLAQSDTRLPGALPLSIEEMKANGCRTVKFSGHDAVEVCFERDGTWYHLYVMDRGVLPRSLFSSAPALLALNDAAVAVWSDSNHDYAVVSPKGMGALKQLAG